MPAEVRTPTRIAEFWAMQMLQKTKSPDFLSAMASFVASGKKTSDPVPDNQLEARVSSLVALLSMTPDFQLK